MTFQNELKRLNQLPLFQFSLASKELFHSNFIAWIFNLYKDHAANIMKDMLNEESSMLTFIQARREKENRKDLILDINIEGSPLKVIVENKVKSLPSKEQLSRYSIKNDFHRAIILSLVKPTFLNDEDCFVVHGVTWKWFSYQQLSKQLKQQVDSIQSINSYHGNILSEYIDFLEILCSIPMDIKFGDYDFSKSSLYGILSEYRLHDIYEKMIHQQIGQRLYEVLVDKYSNVTDSNGWAKGNEDDIFVFNTYGGYSGALAEIKFMVGPGINVGVQLQRGVLNLSVEATNPVLALQLAENLLKKNLWFDFSKLKHPIDKFYPVSKDRLFKKYEPSFFYRGVLLPTLPYHEIIELFDCYLSIAMKNKDLIKSCIP